MKKLTELEMVQVSGGIDFDTEYLSMKKQSADENQTEAPSEEFLTAVANLPGAAAEAGAVEF